MITGSLVSNFISVGLNRFLEHFAFALEPARRTLLWKLVPRIRGLGSLRPSGIDRVLVERQSQMKEMEKHLSYRLVDAAARSL